MSEASPQVASLIRRVQVSPRTSAAEGWPRFRTDLSASATSGMFSKLKTRPSDIFCESVLKRSGPILRVELKGMTGCKHGVRDENWKFHLDRVIEYSQIMS